jgi:hypothetical protein
MWSLHAALKYRSNDLRHGWALFFVQTKIEIIRAL